MKSLTNELEKFIRRVGEGKKFKFEKNYKSRLFKIQNSSKLETLQFGSWYANGNYNVLRAQPPHPHPQTSNGRYLAGLSNCDWPLKPTLTFF